MPMKFAQLTPGRGFSPFNSAFYYGQRLVTSLALRRLCVGAISAGVRLRHGAVSAGSSQRLETLHRDGYLPLGQLLDEQQCDDVLAYLHDKQMSDRHDCTTSFTLDAVPEKVRLGDYPLQHVIACPHILALANSRELLDLAASYIGCKPTISALSLRWSFPNVIGDRKLQSFHRDSDDWRYLKVMVYLTEVNAAGGPHVFVRGTHLESPSLRLRFYDDAEVLARYGAERVISVTGPRGLGFAVDTAGVHKGEVPQATRRLMLQIQYSLLPSYAYQYQPQRYPQPHQFDPYTNRLILA
jgi:hypothetical protein